MLAKKIQEQADLGEFAVIDAKMSETVKDALWPMELGMAGGADLRKFKGEQKQQVDAALAKYGDKELEKIHKLAEGQRRQPICGLRSRHRAGSATQRDQQRQGGAEGCPGPRRRREIQTRVGCQEGLRAMRENARRFVQLATRP